MMQKIDAPALVRAANLADPDECKRIDGFLRDCGGSTPFHLTGWSRAVERACGQKAHYLIAEDAGGEVTGVLPLSEIRSMLFGKALVSAGFAVDGGVLAVSDAVADQLIDAASAYARLQGFPGLELRGGALPDVGAGWHFDETTYLGFARDLAGDDDQELLAIPRKQRAEVRKALGFDLKVDIGSSPRDLKAHFEVYATSVRNLGTPVFPRALFAAMIAELGDVADVLTIRQNGRAIASVLSLYWQGTVYPYWGGGTADARVWRANDLMYYALMCHARAEKNCTRFDFGRSKAGTGPAAFKKNWGFEGTPLRYAKLSLDGAPLRDVNPMSAKYRLQVAAWQKLPLWLANRLGPLLSRGLG